MIVKVEKINIREQINFISYYYKSVENELTKEITEPSFFIPDNDEIEFNIL